MSNTQIDNAKVICTAMLLYNLKEYSDNYSKTFESLYQYYRDEPFLDNNGDIADFPADNSNSALFKYKTKMAGRIGYDGTKNFKVRVPLKYFSNFWRILEMPLIESKINLILTWSTTNDAMYVFHLNLFSY